jgi:hypothetical protein
MLGQSHSHSQRHLHWPIQPFSRRTTAPRPASGLSTTDVVPGEAAEDLVRWCGWHGMQGVRGSNPLSSTAKYQGKRSARATPAGRRTPSKTPVRQASRQHRAPPGNLNARPISSDLSVATPRAGRGGLPSPTPFDHQRPLRSTLRAKGGLPCSRRLGRSRVRHRRDPGRAARATLAWTACSSPRSPARRLPWWSCVSGQASVLSDRPHVLVELSVLVRVHRSNECRACAALVHSDLDLTAVRGLPGRVDG